jgi:hypothetical protein
MCIFTGPEYTIVHATHYVDTAPVLAFPWIYASQRSIAYLLVFFTARRGDVYLQFLWKVTSEGCDGRL